ncbi:hypothetical protein ACFYYH_00255 [Streptomyces sp. NPDC002018]|uniref:hypothetical protein n=1 Tax=Streptomyces sp. NPDC002018 TaxID=3364629 RepID=UPI00367DDB5A
MLKILVRALTAAALLVLPLTTPAPAHATDAQCSRYLQDLGYTYPLLGLQCQLGAAGYTYAYRDCVEGLVDRRVQRVHAFEACRLAAERR